MTSPAPAALDPAQGCYELRDADVEVWDRAVGHLSVRNNDSHSLYAYGIARALCDLHPQADPDVVLPGILLHDTGWSCVAPEDVLAAIAPGRPARPDLVRQHEIEGARIAREILTGLGRPADTIGRISEIIDGHDSRPDALSLEDALLKDADKIWRVTPHGNRVVCGWFGLTPEQGLRLTASRVHDFLFTDAGRAMARAFTAVTSISMTAQLIDLHEHL